MLKFGLCPSLCNILRFFYKIMFKTGYIPFNFNCAIIKPIPKKGKISSPSDYRPISISSVFSSLFEFILLEKIGIIKNTSDNQFGYKEHTSCKSAYFIVKEAIEFYEKGDSPIHVVSLDAVKAFDKLWRAGLFYKLKEKIEPCAWRMLFAYYASSTAIVSADGVRSSAFKTTEGVKQGGILSPFLFNFFMDSLISEIKDLQIGALLGKSNISILAYCDDILLISPSNGHMNIMLNKCERFAQDWKIEFNPAKSVSFCSSSRPSTLFRVCGSAIPAAASFEYLGLPIGNQATAEDFLDQKMLKVERAFFALRGLGCKPAALHPRSIAFFFKQFCQSIIKYGLENIFLSQSKIGHLSIRQNMLVKIILGLNTHSRTKPLYHSLKIEHFEQIYLKHKIFFLKQIGMNRFTDDIYNFLKSYYEGKSSGKASFLSQLEQVKKITKLAPSYSNLKTQLKAIDEHFKCTDADMLSEIKQVLDEFDNGLFFIHIKKLNEILWIDFRNNSSVN